MSWWNFRSHARHRTDTPGVAGVRLDVGTMELVESTSRESVWRDVNGDVLSLTVVPAMSVPLSPVDVQDYFREMAEARQAGLVEARVVEWRLGRAIAGIYKMRRGTGFVFSGTIVMPFRQAALVWMAMAGEQGTTGVREAVVTAQMFKDRSMTPATYQESWAGDPYDPHYRATGRVDTRTLRYLSDDERYDAQFPDHPLSRIRHRLRRIVEDVEIDEDALNQA